MDKNIAEKLLEEIERHSMVPKSDKSPLLEMLVSADVPESSRFYEALPDKNHLIQGDNRYHYLSLRRVLRNRNAENYSISALNKAFEAFASSFGLYSSDVLSRNLRADKDVVKVLAECSEPFSLLGKLQTYDFNNPEEELFVVTRPLLIVPGTNNAGPLRAWEEANTAYEREIMLLGMVPSQEKISRNEYFAHQEN